MAQSGETPVLDLIERMTELSLEASAPLDARTVMLVRLAALIAVDAPPASYAVNVATAADVGVDADQMRGLAAAIAPDRRDAASRRRRGQHHARARDRAGRARRHGIERSPACVAGWPGWDNRC